MFDRLAYHPIVAGACENAPGECQGGLSAARVSAILEDMPVSRDKWEIAAARILEKLESDGGIEFSSSRGVAVLANPFADVLLADDNPVARADEIAEWLIDKKEVADLFATDEDLKTLLREIWEPVAREEPAATQAEDPPAEPASIEELLPALGRFWSHLADIAGKLDRAWTALACDFWPETGKLVGYPFDAAASDAGAIEAAPPPVPDEKVSAELPVLARLYREMVTRSEVPIEEAFEKWQEVERAFITTLQRATGEDDVQASVQKLTVPRPVRVHLYVEGQPVQAASLSL